MKSLQNYIDFNSLVHSLGYLLMAFILFFIGKILYKVLNPAININSELVDKDNFAFIISYVGYFAALITILIAAISGESYGFLEDAKLIGIYSIVGILLLHISAVIANKLIFPKFSIKKEILEDQNAGTGIIEAAVYLANGFLLYGALIGESTTLGEGLTTFFSYWLVGNIILIISTKIFSKWVSYDIHAEIEKDNIAAGISFSGAIVAISLVIMNALLDPFVDWQTSVIEVLLFSLLGIILLPVMRFITDKIILPGRTLTDEIVNQEKPNIGAGLLEAFAYVGGAILVLWIF